MNTVTSSAAVIRTNLEKPKVFYDGSCPMCRREIAHYLKLKSAPNLEWIDISQRQNLLGDYGVDYATAMTRFHVLDAQKQWQTGAYGFAEMWSHLAGYRWLARLLRILKLLPLLDAAYVQFARWRIKQRCQSDSCATKGGDR